MTLANVARMWDYYLGGNENAEADREAARLVLRAAPKEQIADVYDQPTTPLVMLTKEETEQFFSGFELVEPGLVFLSQWRPVTEYYAGGGTRWAYAGVGRKTSTDSMKDAHAGA